MSDDEPFHDGYDLGFCHMLLAADERMRRDLCGERQRQKAAMIERQQKKEQLLQKNGFANFSEDAEIPLTAMVDTLQTITGTELPPVTGRSTDAEAEEWCRTAIRTYTHSLISNPPVETSSGARSTLSRDETLLLMDHVRACSALLDR